MFDPDIAPSGTLLGLLQRGRGDGPLHALAAQRAEALAALEHCVLRDPRLDWRVESRSLYYARLYSDLEGPLDGIEQHLFHPDDLLVPDEHRCGLALSVLGHLAGYGRRDALRLLRRYAAAGGCWEWALDELAVRDDEAGLRALGPAVRRPLPAHPAGRRRPGPLPSARRTNPAPGSCGPRTSRAPAPPSGSARPPSRSPSTAGSARCAPAAPPPAGASPRCCTGPSRASPSTPRSNATSPPPAAWPPSPAPRTARNCWTRPCTARPPPAPPPCATSPTAATPKALDLIEAAAAGGDERVVRAALESFERLSGRRRHGPAPAAGRRAPTNSAPPPPACSPGTAAPATPTP